MISKHLAIKKTGISQKVALCSNSKVSFRVRINGASISVDNLEPYRIFKFYFLLGCSGNFLFYKGQKNLFVLLGLEGNLLITFTGSIFRRSIRQHWLASLWQCLIQWSVA